MMRSIATGGTTAPPACVTLTPCPPACIDPVRDAVVLLAATVYATVPLPVPPAPDVIVIQASALEAVHAQPAAAVTLKVPGPPEAPAVWLAGAAV